MAIPCQVTVTPLRDARALLTSSPQESDRYDNTTLLYNMAYVQMYLFWSLVNFS